MKNSKSLFYFILILLFTSAAVSFWFHWGTQPKSTKKEVKIFVIRKGETTNVIIQKLYREGLIRSAWAFKLLLHKEGLKGKIQAGDFRLSSSQSALEIAQELTHGTLDYWVTIIEGWRSEEIAERLQLPVSYFKKHEGYLFPDTYLLPKDVSSEAVVKILRRNFEQKIADLQTDLKKSGLTLQQVMIFASIVEREARFDDDRSIVAGILRRRWENGWRLQADATVQYFKGRQGEWWPQVKKADLKIDSPYNTYLYSDLPPGPICNPGLAAIKAVIHSRETDYWYYLSDHEGKVHFSKSLEEHNKNIREYL